MVGLGRLSPPRAVGKPKQQQSLNIANSLLMVMFVFQLREVTVMQLNFGWEFRV